MAALTLALLVPIFVSAFILNRVLFEPRGGAARLLCVSLAVGLALGMTSLLFFLWLVLFNASNLSAYFAMEIVFLMCMSGGVLLVRRRKVRIVEPPLLMPSPLRIWLGVGCLAGFVCAVICFVVYSVKSPHGDIDAWAIWNSRARFLIRSGENWRESFTHPRIGWSHPDYPLLVPGSVARLWTYNGQETVLAPCLIGGLFTFASAGLLVSSLSLLRSRGQGYLAGILLFSSPFYLEVGTAQYADVPLGWFFLATLVLWCLERTPEGDQSFTLPILGGLIAGIAAWTKNEGLLFFLVVLLVRLTRDVWALERMTQLRRTGMFVLGALPVLLVLCYFKMRIAPRSDLLGNLSQRPALHLLLLDTGRYWVILRETVVGMGRALNIALGALIVCGVCLGRKSGRADRGCIRVAAVLALMLLGYLSTYFFASWENLENHVRFSVDRLWIQIFPSLLFLFGLAIAAPDQRQASGHAGLEESRLLPNHEHPAASDSTPP